MSSLLVDKKFTYKIEHNAFWLLIFEHNTDKGFFLNADTKLKDNLKTYLCTRR